MARRLLGPVNAASVLDTQAADSVQNAQVTGHCLCSRGFLGLCCGLLVPGRAEMGFIWCQCR